MVYTKIMVPVDLAHANKLGKALTTAADLSKHYGIPVCYVGVTAPTPGEVAHSPAEFAQKLESFGRQEAKLHGHEVTTMACTSSDPSIDLDDTLLKAVAETGADLVVMASHIPGLVEHLWPSHGGKIASHSDASVLVVR